MKLAARQLGWLHATPKTWECTRRDMLLRQGKPVFVPDCEGGEYLLEAMMRLGPSRPGFECEVPTGWAEIAAFMQTTARLSQAWEAEALFDMCRDYLSAKVAGESGLAIAPVEQDGD